MMKVKDRVHSAKVMDTTTPITTITIRTRTTIPIRTKIWIQTNLSLETTSSNTTPAINNRWTLCRTNLGPSHRINTHNTKISSNTTRRATKITPNSNLSTIIILNSEEDNRANTTNDPSINSLNPNSSLLTEGSSPWMFKPQLTTSIAILKTIIRTTLGTPLSQNPTISNPPTISLTTINHPSNNIPGLVQLGRMACSRKMIKVPISTNPFNGRMLSRSSKSGIT